MCRRWRLGRDMLKLRRSQVKRMVQRKHCFTNSMALQGLLAAGDALGEYEEDAIHLGVQCLLSTQRGDGSWHEAYFTGTGLLVIFIFGIICMPNTSLCRHSLGIDVAFKMAKSGSLHG
ncbi:hypothetical protein KP509_1Z160200 [Ceratopteris richardii]|nr:hypothetical protein KP509_1Z160200 [Ceratopteris richardii]